MSEERTPEGKGKTDGRVVYSRLHTDDEADGDDGARRGGGLLPERLSLAPMLVPLLVGFALLIGLVIGLGYLSTKQLQGVSSQALALESQRTAQIKYLLRLQTTLAQLNNEARARARVEGESGLMLPFKFRLSNAREEVDAALKDFRRLPQAETERGRAFLSDVNSYFEVVSDLERYSLEGFPRYREVEKNLSAIIAEVESEQERVPQEIEESKRRASRSIRFLTILSVLTGSLVAALVLWELQRRFRQLRRNIQDLRRERRFSRQILKGLPSAIAALDRQDRIRSANEGFFRIFPEAQIGASVYDKFTTPEGQKLLAAATGQQVERPTYHGRWRLGERDDPAERSFDVYSSPLEIDDERGQLLALVDVTEAAHAETDLRRQESLAAVGRAAAQVAHEIKNPLGSIRLGVAMLRDMTGNPEAISTIDLVERGIDHLNKLTIDVTQFSRQKQLSIAEVDLHHLLDASLDLVSDKIRDKQTIIERQYAPDVLRIEADADQLRQVFVNLFANAVDASPAAAPVTITTGTATIEGRGGANGDGAARRIQVARLTIADRGVGMDEKTRTRLFEPFFTTKKRGTGLGLAIAKQIIDAHGGHITVDSAPGEGTRFTIDLPLRQRDM